MYLDPSLFSNFLILCGDSVLGRLPVLVLPVLVKLLVAVLVVEDCTLLDVGKRVWKCEQPLI